MTNQNHWKKPLRAAGLLGTGKVGQVIFMFGAIALAARTLGAEHFGLLILINSLMMTIAKTAQFQSWQALVHYGAKAQKSDDKTRLQRIIKFSFTLDLLTALLAYAIVWIVSHFTLNLFGLDPALSNTIQAYGTAIILMVLNGTPNGILQLFNRFDRIAWYTASAPFIRLIGSVYLFINDGTFLQFLILWYMAEVFAALILLSMGFLTLYAQDLLAGLFRPSLSPLKPESGIWRYVFGTQVVSTLDLSTTHLPVLFVGGILGPSAAGIYKIAQEFSSVLLKSGAKLFGQAIYPDLARLSAQNDRKTSRQMIASTALLIGAIGLAVFSVFVIFGQQAIMLSAGPGFTTAYPVMIWLCFAGVITVSGFALEPLLISAGFIRQTIMARAVATVFFIPILYSLLLYKGITGVGMAILMYTALHYGALLLQVKKNFKE